MQQRRLQRKNKSNTNCRSFDYPFDSLHSLRVRSDGMKKAYLPDMCSKHRYSVKEEGTP
jgi:hypothetical protein